MKWNHLKTSFAFFLVWQKQIWKVVNTFHAKITVSKLVETNQIMHFGPENA